jgi:hypothetical protein
MQFSGRNGIDRFRCRHYDALRAVRGDWVRLARRLQGQPVVAAALCTRYTRRTEKINMSQVPIPNSATPAAASASPAAADHAPHKPADDREEVYYEGSPLLRGHLGHVFVYTFFGLLLIAVVVYSGYKHWTYPWWIKLALVVAAIILFVVPILIVKRTRYRISNYRIDFERGWLSTTIDTLELWHVEDIKFHQSLLEKILAVGTIEIFSHDDTTPNLFMRGIPHARQLFTTLEQRIIAVKRQRGVLKMDMGT